MLERILVHHPGEGISMRTTVDEFYLVFHCVYDKFNGKDKKRVLSSREIDQLSHFWNEFSQSNETFRVKYCFFNIKYFFPPRKKVE